LNHRELLRRGWQQGTKTLPELPAGGDQRKNATQTAARIKDRPLKYLSCLKTAYDLYQWPEGSAGGLTGCFCALLPAPPRKTHVK